MFALIFSYTACNPYTGFLLMQIFRICAAASNNRVSDTFRLKFAQFDRNVSVEANQTINRTSVGEQPKGSLRLALSTESVFGLSYCSKLRSKDPKAGNSLIREITRAPPDKSSQHFVFYLYKGLSNRVISQLCFKSFFLSLHNSSRY